MQSAIDIDPGPSSTSHRSRTERWEFDAIGVGWKVDTAEPLDDAVKAAVAARIEAYDRSWSRFRDDSLVARIGREPGVWPLPAEAVPLLELYRELYAATGGRMSPLARRGSAALPWADAVAWDAPATRTSPTPQTTQTQATPASPVPPAPPADARHRTDGGGTLRAPRPVLLDVAAAGKGQLADLVSDVLVAHGIAACTVDASGDLRRRGPAVRVALEHPLDPALAVGVLELADGAVAASGQNRQPGHIVDALTGVPARRFIASWVTAPTALIADGVATAVLLLEDPAVVPASLGAEWARMDATGRLEASAGFQGELFR